MLRKLMIFTLFGFVVFSLNPLFAALRFQKAEEQVKVQEDRKEMNRFFSTPLRAGLFLYQKILRDARYSNCPMHPNCSTFSSTAINAEGPFWGYLMTTDRLLRCGHDKQNYKKINTSRGRKLFDPLAIE